MQVPSTLNSQSTDHFALKFESEETQCAAERVQHILRGVCVGTLLGIMIVFRIAPVRWLI